MKILQINCVFKKGSTGKIVNDLHNGYLSEGFESVVCYGRGVKYKDKNVYKVSGEFEAKIHSALSKLFGVEFGFSPIATARTLRVINSEKPNVVHLHCLNGHFINVYTLLKYLKQKKIPTILTLHAEIMHTAGCTHAFDCNKWKLECSNCNEVKGLVTHLFLDDARRCFRKMKKAFYGFTDLTVIGVSEWLTDRAKQSPVFPDKTRFFTVQNGIDTCSFQYTDFNLLKTQMNIPNGKRVILHVTPSFKSLIKGGKYVLELARKMSDYQFIIVGFDGDRNTLTDNIIPIEHTQSKKELAQYYSMADCLICTSLRESFPTVCLEAVSCGCNVVAFKTGGIPEIIPNDMGECISCYDVDSMKNAIIKWAELKVSDARMAEVNESHSACWMVKRYLGIMTTKLNVNKGNES